MDGVYKINEELNINIKTERQTVNVEMFEDLRLVLDRVENERGFEKNYISEYIKNEENKEETIAGYDYSDYIIMDIFVKDSYLSLLETRFSNPDEKGYLLLDKKLIANTLIKRKNISFEDLIKEKFANLSSHYRENIDGTAFIHLNIYDRKTNLSIYSNIYNADERSIKKTIINTINKNLPLVKEIKDITKL